MSDSELAVVSQDSFATPTLITRAGPSTRKKFFEFFTVPIRNANTRAAYYRAVPGEHLTWLAPSVDGPLKLRFPEGLSWGPYLEG
jgi:hypothetical protein